MPDAIDLLTTRRSVAAIDLVEPAPSAGELDLILTIASRVPDHGKLAPWRFLVIEGDARARLGERLAPIFAAVRPEAPAEVVEQERRRFSQSALVVAVISRAGPHVKIPEWEQVLSAGAAAENLVLATHALGYGAQWLTGWAAYEPKALEVLGVAPAEKLAGFVHIGTPRQRLPDRPRPPLAEIVTRWQG